MKDEMKDILKEGKEGGSKQKTHPKKDEWNGNMQGMLVCHVCPLFAEELRRLTTGGG